MIPLSILMPNSNHTTEAATCLSVLNCINEEEGRILADNVSNNITPPPHSKIKLNKLGRLLH
jgi:hypothetical protein